MKKWDCIIVGGGPAGISAAIYLARYNRSVIVIDQGYGGRWQSHKVNENYLGFPRGIEARKLRELGRRQARRFGTQFFRGKVEEAWQDSDGIHVRTRTREFIGRTIILATGVRDILPNIADYEDYWGRTMFWCITCDGWQTRGARVVVVGRDDEAAVTCLQFLNYTRHVSLVTNCPPGEDSISPEVRKRFAKLKVPLREAHIAHLLPKKGKRGVMEYIVFDNGRRIRADYMFSHQGSLPRIALARQLGLDLSRQGFILTDEEQRTNVPFVYAAGDVTRMLAHQVVTAAHEGSQAGCTANYDIYEPEQQSP
ncbi:MAG TPA: NAD(P)/FAD-dependent oxidoreductase [Dehalococcoidia bacterium]|nr:NAD(P)/FAD-dependent oxidoreductase [Dehalococcoidia bacterium]